MIRLTEKEKMDCMNDIQVRQVIRNACVYAISGLMKKGSCQFATKVDGKWIIADWELIVKGLDDILNLNRKGEKNNDSSGFTG